MLEEHGNVVTLHYAQRYCNRAELHPVCPARLSGRQGHGPGLSRHTQTLEGGSHLCRQGDRLKSLFVVHSGSMKGYISTPNGLAHVSKFYLPGDIIGLDALADARHASSVQALETSSFCRIEIGLEAAGVHDSSTLNVHLLKMAGREMVAENRRALILAQRDADVRLGLFLLYLSGEFAKRGFSQQEFNLTMSRRDIASYLALTIETVSRVFGQLQSEGLIEVERRRVRLLSLRRFRQAASAEQPFTEH